jgi:WD40 repeat protein
VRPTFSPDGHWLAAAGPASSLWSEPAWAPVPGLPEAPANTVAAAAAFSPDGTQFAAVFGDHQVRLFRLPSLAPGLTLEAPGNARVLALAFSPDGRTLAVTTTEGEVLLWDLPALELALTELGLPE